MNYSVYAARCWETNDMGITSRGIARKEVAETALVPGGNLLEVVSEEHSAKVISFEKGVLVFEYMGEKVTLQPGHIWHCPMHGVYNPYISESEGFLVGVIPEHDPSKEEKAVERLKKLLGQMRENAAEEGWPVWKNIPLAREYFDILHNQLPISGKHLDATGIMVCCDAIFLEELLNQRDVPRLCLEFLQLRKLASGARLASDEKFDSSLILGVQEADKIQNRLDFYIDPKVTMEWWLEYTHGHLLFDPVERTPEWEEAVYDVEKECDRLLRGQPRGMGFCFAYWSAKRKVLARHGIEWRSPHQMNPRVMFD